MKLVQQQREPTDSCGRRGAIPTLASSQGHGGQLPHHNLRPHASASAGAREQLGLLLGQRNGEKKGVRREGLMSAAFGNPWTS